MKKIRKTQNKAFSCIIGINQVKCIVSYLQEFGFCLNKFSFSKASLVFFLITGIAKTPNYLLFLVAEKSLNCLKFI